MSNWTNITGRPDVQATMPEDFIANAIQQDLTANSLVLGSGVNRVPLARGQARFPVQTLLPQAYFVSGEPVNPLVSGASAVARKQTTRAAWANKYINVEELAVLVPVPDAVQEDAAFDIFGQLRPQIAAALGDAIDNAILFGVNKPTSWDMGTGADGNGIAQVAVAKNMVTTQGGTFAAPTVDYWGDLVKTARLLANVGYPTTAILGDPTLEYDLMGVKDTLGHPLLVPNPQAGGVPSLMGKPFIYLNSGLWPTVTGAATGFYFMLGDWAEALMVGIRRDMTFEVFTQGVITDNTGAIVANLMQQDISVLRVTMRLGATVANPINRRISNKQIANYYPFAVYRGPQS